MRKHLYKFVKNIVKKHDCEKQFRVIGGITGSLSNDTTPTTFKIKKRCNICGKMWEDDLEILK